MVGKRHAKTDCVGGPSCPLGLDKHPVATSKPTKTSPTQAWPLGCGICRSERQSALKVTGQTSHVNIEERKEMKSRFQKLRPK